jgi:hypothetical protein
MDFLFVVFVVLFVALLFGLFSVAEGRGRMALGGREVRAARPDPPGVCGAIGRCGGRRRWRRLRRRLILLAYRQSDDPVYAQWGRLTDTDHLRLTPIVAAAQARGIG